MSNLGKRSIVFCMCGHTKTRHQAVGRYAPLDDLTEKRRGHCITCECPSYDEFPKAYCPAIDTAPPIRRYPRRSKD